MNTNKTTREKVIDLMLKRGESMESIEEGLKENFDWANRSYDGNVKAIADVLYLR